MLFLLTQLLGSSSLRTIIIRFLNFFFIWLKKIKKWTNRGPPYVGGTREQCKIFTTIISSFVIFVTDYCHFCGIHAIRNSFITCDNGALRAELVWSFGLCKGEIRRPSSVLYAFTKQHFLIYLTFCGSIFHFHPAVYCLRALWWIAY